MVQLPRDQGVGAPALRTLSANIGSKEEKSKTHVMGRVGDSMGAYGGQNTIFRELNRQYLGLLPPIQPRDNDRAIITGRDEEVGIHVPVSFAIIESAVPLWVFAQFGHVPHLDVIGRTQDDDEKAEAVRNMLDYDFQQGKILLEAVSFAKSLFKYGTGIAKVGYKYDARMVRRRYKRKIPTGWDFFKRLTSKWEYYQRKEPHIFFDGPTLRWVSVFNFGVDPLYWRQEEMRYKWERRWTDRDTLKWENEQHKKLTGKPLYKNLNSIPFVAKGGAEAIYQMDGGDDTAEMMGWSKFPGFRQPSYAQVRDVERDRDRAVEIIDYWEKFPEPRRVQIANGETVIHDGENPWDDQEDPYVMTPCITLEDCPWGVGLLQIIRPLQEELDSHRDLTMRQARLNVQNLWAVDEMVDLPEQALQVEPGDVVQLPFFANGNPAMAPLMQGRPLPPEAHVFEERLLTDIQRAVAFSALRMGGGGEQGIDTATEAQMMGQAEQMRVRLYNLIGEHTFLQEVGKKMFSRRQQFFREDQVFRILGKDGHYYRRFSIEEIVGSYDFIPQGSPSQIGGNVLRQQLIELLAVTGQNQIVAQHSNVYEIWLEIWRRVEGVRHPEKYVIPPPERTWSPEMENKVLNHGEFVPVQPTDNHQLHVQGHTQGMAEAATDNPRVYEAYEQHIQQHNAWIQPGSQGGTPPQEQPGPKGFPGNVAAPQNMSVPSEGGLQAKMGGMGG